MVSVEQNREREISNVGETGREMHVYANKAQTGVLG